MTTTSLAILALELQSTVDAQRIQIRKLEEEKAMLQAEVNASHNLRKIVHRIVEGFTLRDDIRKMLETSLHALVPVTPSIAEKNLGYALEALDKVVMMNNAKHTKDAIADSAAYTARHIRKVVPYL